MAFQSTIDDLARLQEIIRVFSLAGFAYRAIGLTPKITGFGRLLESLA
jgi:hypothetical protein